MELHKLSPGDLDKFIEDRLLPDTQFRTEVRKAIDIICSFLKERCFVRGDSRAVRVSKVVKGGSSGKGTTLRSQSDADLVVFISSLDSFQEQHARRGEFIREIKTQLEACRREGKLTVKFEVQDRERGNPRALGFTLGNSRPELVDFDVLPAFDILGQVTVTEHYRPDPRVYVRLIEACKSLGVEGGEFSSCFTELQRAFLKERPAKLKSLVRLVKHWYRKCEEKSEQPLPPKYALELLTIHAWERAGRKTDFVTAQGFYTVLTLVTNYQKLCIYWTKYYDIAHPVIGPYVKRQLQKPRPVILDPADPTGNVGGEPGRWDRLAREARRWMTYPCLKDRHGSPVGSWDIEI